MPDYLFENIASTPYAKTLSMQRGVPLSAFEPGTHSYLTSADILAGAKISEPEPVVETIAEYLPETVVEYLAEPIPMFESETDPDQMPWPYLAPIPEPEPVFVPIPEPVHKPEPVYVPTPEPVYAPTPEPDLTETISQPEIEVSVQTIPEQVPRKQIKRPRKLTKNQSKPASVAGSIAEERAKPADVIPPEPIPLVKESFKDFVDDVNTQDFVKPKKESRKQAQMIFDQVEPEPVYEKPKVDVERLYDYDIAVIGGGPAGYTVAQHAAENGAKVILFEKDEIGGADLYRGRVPAKVYLKMADQLRQINKESAAGIKSPRRTLDLKNCVMKKNDVVETLAKSIYRRLNESGVTVVNSRAALKSRHEIFSSSGSFTADKIVFCGGREPVIPSLRGINHPFVTTSEDIFSRSVLPKRLVVLGGGDIGCAIAEVYSSFGSKVVIIEKNSTILPNADFASREKTKNILLSMGVRLFTGLSVIGVTDAEGRPCAETERGGVECDLLFIAAGRKPNLLGLGFLTNQIEQENGSIIVNDSMETSVEGIYAAGDIISKKKNDTRNVVEMAKIAAESALQGLKKRNTNLI